MTTTADSPFSERQKAFAQINRLFEPAIQRLDKLITAYTFFNIFFLLLAGFEIALFLSFFTWLGQSTVLAFALALFFLTAFSYAIIRLYLQAKKPEQLTTLAEEFITACKETIHYQENILEDHLYLANALQKLTGALHEKEYSYYVPPKLFSSLAPLMEKFSAFCHHKEIHRLKEILLTRATLEHIKVVKCEPTNLRAHAALANAYVMLSSLYADPRKYEGYDEERWIPAERLSESSQKKFYLIAARAIEEFKILSDYAPDDPWVHIQLAYSYHDLQMPEEEIKAYESILRLRPDDMETAFKLGLLYFQHGKNSSGLKIYEQLKSASYAKADHLIKFYGSFDLTL